MVGCHKIDCELKKNVSSSIVSEKKMDPICQNNKSPKPEFRNHSRRVYLFLINFFKFLKNKALVIILLNFAFTLS